MVKVKREQVREGEKRQRCTTLIEGARPLSNDYRVHHVAD